MSDSYVFYRSFAEALEQLPAEQYKTIMVALNRYALDGVTPELDWVLNALFILIKPQIDTNNKRRENGKKGAEYGKLGGRPKAETPTKPQDNPTTAPNVNVNVNANVNEEKKKRFVPPTLEEVQAYCREKDLRNVNPKQFLDYFTESKWVDSKGNKVRNWKQKLLTWNGFTRAAPQSNQFNRIVTDQAHESQYADFERYIDNA